MFLLALAAYLPLSSVEVDARQVVIHCLSREDAQAAIVDESYELYFSRLQRREIAALTGKTVQCDSLDDCRQEARCRFRAAALGFSADEEAAIRWFVEQLTALLGEDYPLYARHPWRFLKTQNHLCSGFPHTRGLCIIFCQRIVDAIVRSRNGQDARGALRGLGSLFVHEQMHVLQRCYPERFAGLYQQEMGLQRAQVESAPWLTERQILNPDALRMEWIVPVGAPDQPSSYYWIRTILKGDRSIPRMGADFLDLAVSVVPRNDHFRVVTDDQGKPVFRRVEELGGYLARFPIQRGLDHPNEITAYMFGQMLVDDYLDRGATRPGQDHPLWNTFRRWCRENLD
jgi:hypothetical protein